MRSLGVSIAWGVAIAIVGLVAADCGLDITGQLGRPDEDVLVLDGDDERHDVPPHEGGAETATSVGDSSADASDDATSDATADACPATCNGGCGADGGVCTITITTFSSATINCPPGFACRVECTGTEVCAPTINCAASRPCTLVCTGKQACTSGTSLVQGSASSVCLVCNGGGGDTGCDSMSCTASSCTRVCDGLGCGGSCSGCTTAAACP